jgi:FtsZ-binding cell division protein ZapB
VPEKNGEAVNKEAFDTTLHFIRESVTELTKKMDAFFRRVDEHEKQTGAVKTEVEVWKEKHSQLMGRCDKMEAVIEGPDGVVARLRANESKLVKIYAISGVIITGLTIAAIILPMIKK